MYTRAPIAARNYLIKILLDLISGVYCNLHCVVAIAQG